jgi:hypothetical protein
MLSAWTRLYCRAEWFGSFNSGFLVVRHAIGRGGDEAAPMRIPTQATDLCMRI